MKVFITGGTGFIGNHLVKRLLETDHELVCLAREKSKTQFLEDSGVKIIIGDVTDKNSFQNSLEGCDWLIHLASSFVFWVPKNKVYHEVNVTGTRNVMECALEKGISKIVYVSTAAVYGNAAKPTSEETPVGTIRASKYVQTKYEGDLIAWDLS